MYICMIFSSIANRIEPLVYLVFSSIANSAEPFVYLFFSSVANRVQTLCIKFSGKFRGKKSKKNCSIYGVSVNYVNSACYLSKVGALLT